MVENFFTPQDKHFVNNTALEFKKRMGLCFQPCHCAHSAAFYFFLKYPIFVTNDMRFISLPGRHVGNLSCLQHFAVEAPCDSNFWFQLNEYALSFLFFHRISVSCWIFFINLAFFLQLPPDTLMTRENFSLALALSCSAEPGMSMLRLREISVCLSRPPVQKRWMSIRRTLRASSAYYCTRWKLFSVSRKNWHVARNEY